MDGDTRTYGVLTIRSHELASHHLRYGVVCGGTLHCEGRSRVFKVVGCNDDSVHACPRLCNESSSTSNESGGDTSRCERGEETPRVASSSPSSSPPSPLDPRQRKTTCESQPVAYAITVPARPSLQARPHSKSTFERLLNPLPLLLVYPPTFACSL